MELALGNQVPRDAWFFPKHHQLYVPDIWFVPLWSPSKQPGKDDPDCVQMVWRKRHIGECPGQPHIRGGPGPSQRGGVGRRRLGRGFGFQGTYSTTSAWSAASSACPASEDRERERETARERARERERERERERDRKQGITREREREREVRVITIKL